MLVILVWSHLRGCVVSDSSLVAGPTLDCGMEFLLFAFCACKCLYAELADLTMAWVYRWPKASAEEPASFVEPIANNDVIETGPMFKGVV